MLGFALPSLWLTPLIFFLLFFAKVETMFCDIVHFLLNIILLHYTLHSVI
jgi:hypothetical protein